MKGKGKGDRSSTSEYKTEKPESPLISYPDIHLVDHVKHCPRYTAVLSRPKDELIGIEELDLLQSELELLLTSAAKCMRVLHHELEPVVEPKESKPPKETKGKDIKGKGTGKGKREDEIKDEPGTPSKRSAGGKDKDETPSKKFKGTPGKGTPGRGPKGKDEPSGKKGKGTPTPSGKDKTQPVEEPPPPPETPDTPVDDIPMLPVALQPAETAPAAPVRVPKNDAPNRFWNMVEPYCAELTTDDLKVLEDIMRSHEDDVEFYKIPPVGKHYSEKWAHEDMLEEQRQGRKLNDKKKNSSSGSSGPSDLLKRAKDSENADSPFGPLTQRLVQALIEENIMAPLDETSISEADAAEAATISPRSLAKQLNIGNTAAIERRIKRELEENGILEPDDKTSDEDPSDEILNELKKKQAELKAISQHNMMVTKRLYKLAKEEMARQDLQKKLIVADAEVMDAYRKIQSTRLKNKSPSKKELDAAKRALKERDSLVKQLESSMY